MAFKNFPDSSKVWIYGFNEALNLSQQELVKTKLENFIKNWMWHGSPVTGDFELVQNRFVVLAATDTISGCSIDSSVSVFKELKQKDNLDAINHDLVFFRQDSEIKALTRQEFKDLVTAGGIDSDTIVFNFMINNLHDYKAGKFETRFNDSWHGKAFPLPNVSVI